MSAIATVTSGRRRTIVDAPPRTVGHALVTAEPAGVRHSDGPWSAEDFIRGLMLAAGGLLGLIACWFGCAGEARWDDQVVWVGGACAALTVAGLGMGGWLLAGFRAVRREERQARREVKYLCELRGVQAVDEIGVALEAPTNTMPRLAVPSLEHEVWVTARAMSRYHTPQCQLMRGKEGVVVRPADLRSTALSPCPICLS